MPSALKLLNPLSEEHEVMVPSLLPGLVHNALDNWHRHFGAAEELPIRLFELRPVFSQAAEGQKLQAQGEMETGARERYQLAIALSGSRYAQALKADQVAVDFYDLKSIVETLLETLGARGVRFQPMTASRTGGNPLFHPGQSVEILAGKDVAGYFGLMHPGKATGAEASCAALVGPTGLGSDCEIVAAGFRSEDLQGVAGVSGDRARLRFSGQE